MRVSDYAGGSLLNLVASIVTACGGDTGHPDLRDLPPEELAGARNIVFILFDAMGAAQLDMLPDGALAAHRRRNFDTVYPPTTAAAVTTIFTGLPPSQHGLVGWFVHFRSLGLPVAVLPFRARGGDSLTHRGLHCGAFYGLQPVFPGLSRPTVVLSPADIARSPYNAAMTEGALTRSYADLNGFFGGIRYAAREPGPKLISAYWPGFDGLGHEVGPEDARALGHLRDLDEGFARLLSDLAGTDSIVVATADHGMVTVQPENYISLDDHPGLSDCLLLPFSGEPRTAYCHVLHGREDEFVAYVRRNLDHALWVEPSEAVVARGLFGPPPLHPDLSARLGDFILFARDGYALDVTLPGEERHLYRGVHGGPSVTELEIPLIVARVS